MSTKAAALRSELESALGACFPASFTYSTRKHFEMVPSGIPAIDRITGFANARIDEPGFPGSATMNYGADRDPHYGEFVIGDAQGGLPRGALTEIVGPSSSGRTSVILSLLAQMTSREEVCALVDSSDAFDPRSAEAAGVDLKRLLWVRCGNESHADRWRDTGSGVGSKERTSCISNRAGRKAALSNEPTYCELEQALKTTDLLLAGGGFGVVIVDLSDIPPQFTRRVPLAHWFRFRRTVEHTPTALVLLEQLPFAKTCASLVLHFEPKGAYWSRAAAIDDSDIASADWGPASANFSALPTAHASAEPGIANPRVQSSLAFQVCDNRGIAATFSSPVLQFQTASAAAGAEQSEATPTLQCKTRCAYDSRKSVSHECLLRGARFEVEILRSRLQQLPVKATRASFEVSAA